MTEKLYYADQYLKEFEAKVQEIRSVEGGTALVLDRTAFYPEKGGQPADRGIISGPEGELEVSRVLEEGDDILHVGTMKGSLSPGDLVKGRIEWDRRYRLMRMHTTAHLLETAVERVIGPAKVWGSAIDVESSRLDFKARIARESLPTIEQEVNDVVKADVPVIAHLVSEGGAEELLSKYGMSLGEEYRGLGQIRIVEIQGVRMDLCGGTHVSRTGEIGSVSVPQRKSKGAGITRLRFTVQP